MDIEKATKIIKYKIKKYKEELEIELEDKIDEPRIAYLLQQKSAIDTVLSELEKKDKIIDLMAEQLAGLAIFDIEKDEPLILGDKEEVKEYFTKKVEGK